MFTVKAYAGENIRLFEADDLTVLRGSGEAEITLHRRVGGDLRIDVKDRNKSFWPRRFDTVIVENSAGKTTEIFRYMPIGLDAPKASAEEDSMSLPDPRRKKKERPDVR